MSDEKKSTSLPLSLLALDFVGALVIVTGLMELFDRGSVVPEQWRFNGLPFVAIVVGASLMWPFIKHVIRNAQAAREADD